MITDALVAFIGLGNALSLVGGTGQTFASGIVDLTGSGVGTPPGGGNIIGTSSTTFGEDPGVGLRRPELNVTVGTAFTAAAGTTLKIALQAAADTAVTYQPGTWTDIVSQDLIAIANLTAGAVPFRVPYLPTMPPNLRPRYLRLLFSPQLAGATPSGLFTAGTIASALVTMCRDDWAAKYAQRNFSVS